MGGWWWLRKAHPSQLYLINRSPERERERERGLPYRSSVGTIMDRIITRIIRTWRWQALRSIEARAIRPKSFPTIISGLNTFSLLCICISSCRYVFCFCFSFLFISFLIRFQRFPRKMSLSKMGYDDQVSIIWNKNIVNAIFGWSLTDAIHSLV